MESESFKRGKTELPDGVIAGRHSVRSDKLPPEATEYKGLTEGVAVEAVRERMPEIFNMIESADADALVVLMGASEEPRVKSTIEVMGDLLEDKYGSDSQKIILTRSKIQKIEGKKVIDTLSGIVANNPNKQVVVDYPLFIKELSLRPHMREQRTGAQTEFTQRTIEAGVSRFGDYKRYDTLGNLDVVKTQQAEATDGAKIFFDMSEEEIESFGGATPQHIAEQHVHAIHRITSFIKSQLHEKDRGRELIIGMVGHGWNLDSFFSYLANEGTADMEGYMKATGNGEAVNMPEFAQIKIGHDGESSTFSFRGKDFEIPPNTL